MLDGHGLILMLRRADDGVAVTAHERSVLCTVGAHRLGSPDPTCNAAPPEQEHEQSTDDRPRVAVRLDPVRQAAKPKGKARPKAEPLNGGVW